MYYGGGQHGYVLGGAGQLDPGHIARRGHVEPGRAQCVGELSAQGAIDRGEHHRAAVLEHLGCVGRAAQGGDRARGAALGHERGGQRAERGHEALGEHEHAGATRDLVALGGHHGGQRAGGDG